ncbi:MAG: type II secretion system protein [Planctomycetes bacterium]|nr:type II secretion system protein [Planctomycetota bacterium]
MGFRKAVTLLELIIVIAIMMILMSMFLPVLGNARRKAAKVYCDSQMSEVSRAVAAYAQEHGRPPPRSWLPSVDRNSIYLPVVLGRFVGNQEKLFRCPGDTAGFSDRPPPNSGRSFVDTEQSSYSYMPDIGVAEYEPFHETQNR